MLSNVGHGEGSQAESLPTEIGEGGLSVAASTLVKLKQHGRVLPAATEGNEGWLGM